MSLQVTHLAHGATLAADGIPLHYGDLAKEYDAALNAAIILDRSHEGRVQLFGESRFEILNRISTNKMIEMQADEGRPTIFTSPNARIIDRIEVYNRADHLLIVTEPGRNGWLMDFLQKNIFFGDDARLVDDQRRHQAADDQQVVHHVAELRGDVEAHRANELDLLALVLRRMLGLLSHRASSSAARFAGARLPPSHVRGAP